MAGPGGGRDQTSNDPTGNFGGSGLAQYGQSYYPIDTELTSGATNFNIPPYARQMEDVGSPADKIEHGSLNNMPMDTNGSAPSSVIDPGMAPPQTPGQPSYLPRGSRPSLDASGETPQDLQAGDKRKRSKASRACDECRRKKVKCDAPTEADGTPKTCTNCQKAGVNCEFERKPMKRGPSKGYISQLAERVQGLEQQQRQSFDAATGGFAESFSPDAQTGPGFPNRAPSFPSHANPNPFPRSEYDRDKIPSVGWSNNSPGSGLRSREVGSLAVAPNESLQSSLLEDATQEKAQFRGSKSLAAEIFDTRPTKRQRTQGPDDEMESILPPKFDETLLGTYYQQYHPQFALLPDSARVLEVVSNADIGTQYAFVTAVDLLPNLRAPPSVNGNYGTNPNLDPAINSPRKSLKYEFFENYESLHQFVSSEASVPRLFRSEEESLTLVWTMALLGIGWANDLKHLKQVGALSLASLLTPALSVLEQVRSDDAQTIPGPTTIVQLAQYSEEKNQVYCCLTTLLKYHAFGIGVAASDILSVPQLMIVAEVDARKLPTNAAYIASSANLLDILCRVVMPNTDRVRTAASAFLRQMFTVQFSFYIGSNVDNTIVKQLRTFMEMSIAACMDPLSSGPTTLLDVLAWVDKMTEVLVEEAQANASAQCHNPLDLTLWSVTALVLCQFVTDVSSRALADLAGERLDVLRTELQIKSEAFHRNYGLEWYFGGKMEHWTDVVLTMIDYVKARPSAVNDEDISGNMFVVPELAKTLEKGWLNGVMYFAGK